MYSTIIHRGSSVVHTPITRTMLGSFNWDIILISLWKSALKSSVKRLGLQILKYTKWVFCKFFFFCFHYVRKHQEMSANYISCCENWLHCTNLQLSGRETRGSTVVPTSPYHPPPDAAFWRRPACWRIEKPSCWPRNRPVGTLLSAQLRTNAPGESNTHSRVWSLI